MSILAIAATKKGIVMEINNKKNCPSHVIIIFAMLLFAMCLTANTFFCGNDTFYELLDKTRITETWAISESITTNEDSDNALYFTPSFLNENNSQIKSITRKLYSNPIIASILKEFSLFLYLTIFFLYFFFTLFILLPDEWTLTNQKVRMDN